MAVIQPTGDERLTLITCTGTFLPLQRDYDKRLVVIASRHT
jgi:sortase (surface protein transpeptidase)